LQIIRLVISADFVFAIAVCDFGIVETEITDAACGLGIFGHF